MIIRFAKLSDKDAILDFTKDTWDGYDYIHRVLDKWLIDEEGQLLVAEEDEKAIALARTSYLGEGVYWLEGLRVAKDKRQLGIGEQLAQRQLEEVEKLNPKCIRLSTYYLNHSIPIIEKMHFQRVGEFQDYFYPVDKKWQGQVARTPCELLSKKDMQAYLKQENLEESLVGFDWVFTSLTEKLLDKLEKEKALFSYKGVPFIVSREYVKENILALVLLSEVEVGPILYQALQMAKLQKCEGVYCMANRHAIIQQLIESACENDEEVEFSVFVYERNGN